MNFPQIAQQVIDKLGGKENIATAAHCATRLRIVLNDESKVDKEASWSICQSFRPYSAVSFQRPSACVRRYPAVSELFL